MTLALLDKGTPTMMRIRVVAVKDAEDPTCYKFYACENKNLMGLRYFLLINGAPRLLAGRFFVSVSLEEFEETRKELELYGYKLELVKVFGEPISFEELKAFCKKL